MGAGHVATSVPLDEPGKGGGLVSQVNTQISHDIEHSKSVFINGRPVVRTGDRVWMNWKKG